MNSDTIGFWIDFATKQLLLWSVEFMKKIRSHIFWLWPGVQNRNVIDKAQDMVTCVSRKITSKIYPIHSTLNTWQHLKGATFYFVFKAFFKKVLSKRPPYPLTILKCFFDRSLIAVVKSSLIGARNLWNNWRCRFDKSCGQTNKQNC